MKQTEQQKQINKYLRSYMKRHKVTKEEALEHEIVKNMIAWIKLRYE